MKRASIAYGLLYCVVVAVGAQEAAAQPASAPNSGTVLVTGANRGLGLEFVSQYAELGWKVIATARDIESAAALRELAGVHPNVSLEQLDVRDGAAIERLAAEYRDQPIDVLINNAGVLGDMDAQTLGTLEYGEFEQVMAVNAFAPLAIAEAFREHVAASAEKKIVSITSRSGVISLPGRRGPYYYRASKAAMNMLMRVLADDLREQGVIVALVSPPPTDTDMLRDLIGAEAAAAQARPVEVVARMIDVIDGLTLESTAAPIYFDGTAMPW